VEEETAPAKAQIESKISTIASQEFPQLMLVICFNALC
jgi:hypothetical protein